MQCNPHCRAFRARLHAEAFELPADTSEQLAAVIRAELVKWAGIVKEAGIRPE